MKINEVTLKENQKLPQTVIDAFVSLGNQQRGGPEKAMLKIQHAAGGGVLPVVVEHSGDLIHRMTEMLKFSSEYDGREYILSKTEKVYKILSQEYGFEKEFIENLKTNAKAMEKEPEEFKEKIFKLLEQYKNEFEKLTPYNYAQALAIKIPKTLGERDWKSAEVFTKKLKKLAEKSAYEWNQLATDYELDSNGEPIPFSQR